MNTVVEPRRGGAASSDATLIPPAISFAGVRGHAEVDETDYLGALAAPLDA